MRRFARLQLALLRSVRSTQAVMVGTKEPPSSSNAPPAQELELDETPIVDRIAWRQTERRLLLAQHWARGALCSQPHEAWRLICKDLSVCALACEDFEAVERLLCDAVGQAGAEPQLANVWRQALAELQEARSGEGAAIVDSANWPFPALRVRSRELLQSTQVASEQLLSATH